MREITIVIVDDHPLLRKGLADHLSSVREFSIVGQAENGAKALEVIQETSPNVAIVDIDMPIMDGVELVKFLRKRGAETDIVFLTVHKDRALLRSLPKLGVRGYVLKDSATDEIIECIRSVTSGRRYVSPKLEGSPKDPKDDALLAGIEDLTPSELRVLYFISLSRTSREIAEHLAVSVRTVEAHRYNVGSKLGLAGTHALLKFAVEHKSEILNAYTLSETT